MADVPISPGVEVPLASQDSQQRIPLSASLITQILVAVACLMGGAILPTYYPEFRGVTRAMMFAAGGAAAVAAFVNAFFGRQISRMTARMGMRSRVVIPREGLVYLGMMLLLAVGGLVGHSNMLLLVFGLMAGPWVLNGWFVYMALRNVTVERRARDRVMAGEPMVVDVTAHNNKRWITSRLIDVRDEISSHDHSQLLGAGIVTIVRLPAGEHRTGHYQVTFSRRGLYQLGPLRISSRFPLGIGERGQLISQTQSVLIRPKTGRLRPGWLKRHQDRAESRLTHSPRTGVFDDEFHRIRELRTGDNPRSIHWRSTARRGQLMVQEFHENRDPNFFVLLDLCDDADFSDESAELAVSAAATLCASRAHGGSDGPLMLAITGEKPVFVSDIKPARFTSEAMDALAVCRPAPSPPLEPALRQLADGGALHRDRGILITSRPEYCRLAIVQLCSDLVPDAFDIMRRLAIVSADFDSLNEMMILDAANGNAPRKTGVPEKNGVPLVGALQ